MNIIIRFTKVSTNKKAFLLLNISTILTFTDNGVILYCQALLLVAVYHDII